MRLFAWAAFTGPPLWMQLVTLAVGVLGLIGIALAVLAWVLQ